MRLAVNYRWDGLRRKIQGGVAGLCLALPMALLAQSSEVPPTPTPVQTAAPARPVLPWIDEVVKMNAAGVPPDVIKNYIANSSSRSTLTADDIIYLRNSGVSSDLIGAMITHGSAASSMVASTPTPAVAPPYYPPQQYQPPVAYPDQTTPPDYNSYDAGLSYPYAYSYSYSYPGYYPYYPLYWYPYTTFFVGGRRDAFFRGDRFGHSFGGWRVFGAPRVTSGGHIVGNAGVHTGRR